MGDGRARPPPGLLCRSVGDLAMLNQLVAAGTTDRMQLDLCALLLADVVALTVERCTQPC